MKRSASVLSIAGVVTLLLSVDGVHANQHSPPRGYDTWNAFGMHFNESMVLQQAEYLSTTLAGGSYKYLILDEGWEHVEGLRDKWVLNDQGFPMPNIGQFPSAAKTGTLAPLAKQLKDDYDMVLGLWLLRGVTQQAVDLNLTMKIHGGGTIPLRDIADMGQKCTWHTDVYALNMSNPYAQLWVNNMISMYSDWGVGYFKVDCIFGPDLRKENIIGVATAVSQARNSLTGEMPFLSLSPGGKQSITERHWIVDTLTKYGVKSSSYRIANDLHDCWANGEQILSNCVTYLAKRFTAFADVMKPVTIRPTQQVRQSYPDGDMFPIGGFGLFGGDFLSPLTKPHLLRFHLGLWNLVQSPAIISGNVRYLSTVPGVVNVVNNSYLAAMHQSGREPRLLVHSNNQTLNNTADKVGTYVWVSSKADMAHQYWLGFFAYDGAGHAGKTVNMTVPVKHVDSEISSFAFYEIFSGQVMYSTTSQSSSGNITFEVPVNDARIFLIQPLSP